MRYLSKISALILSFILSAASSPEPVRIGIIGLDTSHSTAFTRFINDPSGEGLVARYEVVAAYPQGSTTIAGSMERIPQFTEEMRAMGVEIVGSIEDLLQQVDMVLLETNDGKPHLEEALHVLRAGKPLFVDKPVAASLEDVVAIYDAATHYGVPIFSSSSLRYMKNAQALRAGGDVKGAFAYSPSPMEPSHADLYWYGIHGVETLFTVMGTGCESVVRMHVEGAEVVTCRWADGRVGTFYGIRDGKHGYGGTVFTSDRIENLGPYEGYDALVMEILGFFETGISPVPADETIEIYAFMSAADESKRLGGAPVSVNEVLEDARARAAEKLDKLRR